MSKRLWTAYEAAAATGGTLCAKGGDPERWEAEEWSADGIAIDSRNLKPGEIFVALNDVRDGHDFIGNAFNAGASAALSARVPHDLPEGKPVLVVRDTLEGLRDLARAARLRNFGKRIAVTGSAGKTSTKDMLRQMLSAAGEVHAADRSFNNHFGVPLTLARMPMTSKFSVFEIGMNHPGEITPLVDLVTPHIAMITTVAPAHLEFFDNVEAIAYAKAEIFTGLKDGGTAIIPKDNAHYALLNEKAEQSPAKIILTFGRHKDADMRLLDIVPNVNGQMVKADFRGQVLSFQMGAPGEHQAMNALAAILAATSVGAPMATILPSLKAFNAGAGRGEQLILTLPGGRGQALLIDESYNANPASMAAAIQLLGKMQPVRSTGRRIAVLGEMLELGDDAAALHAGLAANLQAAGIDSVYMAGPLMEALKSILPASKCGGFSDDPSEIARKLTEEIHDGDIIMVKGSNASKVSQVVNVLKLLDPATKSAH